MLVSPQIHALPETVLVAPVPRDGSFSGLERDQLATPLAHVEWPDRQPKHQLSGAASRPRAPSPRVVSRPPCGASPMCNAELFVYFAFLVSVGVVACIFASCVSLVAL